MRRAAAGVWLALVLSSTGCGPDWDGLDPALGGGGDGGAGGEQDGGGSDTGGDGDGGGSAQGPGSGGSGGECAGGTCTTNASISGTSYEIECCGPPSLQVCTCKVEGVVTTSCEHHGGGCSFPMCCPF
jgi:hypothetical protein